MLSSSDILFQQYVRVILFALLLFRNGRRQQRSEVGFLIRKLLAKRQRPVTQPLLRGTDTLIN